MAEILKTTNENVMDLDEFFEVAKGKVKIGQPESLSEMAEEIQALSNNKEFFINQVHKDLKSHAVDKPIAMYSSQSCIVKSDGLLSIRVNLWPTLPADPRRRAILAQVLSYYDYHDHNFSFLTANYFGPGYETNIHNYSREGVHGYIGEKIDAKDLGFHTLDDQTVINFQSQRDFHSQLPPEELSSSINLMLYEENSQNINQYYFDPKKSCISGYVASDSTKRANVISFAKSFSNDQTLLYLEEIAKTAKCPRLRMAAYDAIYDISPSDRSAVLLDCEKDESILVQHYSKELQGVYK